MAFPFNLLYKEGFLFLYILVVVELYWHIFFSLLQYLERRECEYDAKTLVNFYKVRLV